MDQKRRNYHYHIIYARNRRCALQHIFFFIKHVHKRDTHRRFDTFGVCSQWSIWSTGRCLSVCIDKAKLINPANCLCSLSLIWRNLRLPFFICWFWFSSNAVWYRMYYIGISSMRYNLCLCARYRVAPARHSPNELK